MIINELASVANQGKPNKKRAHELVKELAERHPESVAELGALYAYFMPPKPKTPKTAWQWVVSAMGKKDVRYYLNYVYVDEHYITATDGHRMHRIENDEQLPPGYYNSIGDLVERQEFAKYPDVDRIVPNPDSRQRVTANTGKWSITEIKGVVAYEIADGLYANKQYMDAALNHPAGVECLYIGSGRDSIRIMYKGDNNQTAVVMPMRG